MGLGEGSGAALAINLIETSVRILREMRTFEEAGIQNPLNENARK
jgi:nicotinate-nucleotide--dimethylbenzimidazole phosphoribosyltransferase